MREPKISIIVPIYNVEKEIHRCIESLLCQTLKDIEIILVNDGSTDNCPAICDEYTEKDKRVRVFHKKNGGLSDARNYGLLKALGEYIMFVDSDDYIVDRACEKLYSGTEENLDIIVGDAKRIDGKDEITMDHPEVPIETVLSGTDFLQIQLKSEKMSVVVWLNLYCRIFLLENKLFFKSGIMHEDVLWTPRVFLKADRVKYINFIFYNYIIRRNSITQSESKIKKAMDILIICYELEGVYEKVSDLELKKLLNNDVMRKFLDAIDAGNLYSEKYKHLYSKGFVIGKPLGFKSKVKAYLFFINKKAYKHVYGLYTSIRYDA